MKPRNRNSASAEKRAEKSTMNVFYLALLFFEAVSKRFPSKRDDSFCLSSPLSAGQAGKAKISCLSCRSCLKNNALINKLPVFMIILEP